MLEGDNLATATLCKSLRRSQHLLGGWGESDGSVGTAVVRQLLHRVAEGCEKGHLLDVHLLEEEWHHVAVGLHDGHNEHGRLERRIRTLTRYAVRAGNGLARIFGKLVEIDVHILLFKG